MGDFRDGHSNTLLISESLTQLQNGVTWYQTNDSKKGEKWFNVMTWLYAHDGPNKYLDKQNASIPSDVAAPMKINGGDRKSKLPQSAATARPSSGHPGGVNVMFADGRGAFIAEDVDYYVLSAVDDAPRYPFGHAGSHVHLAGFGL